MIKCNLKNDTMNECQIQKIHTYPIYRRDSNIYSEKCFVNIDNGSQRGTHWVCFGAKDNKSFCFALFGGQPDKLIFNQKPKPKTYLIYKIHDINSILCGSYCFYFFYLFERMNYYGAISEMHFG